MLSGSPSFPADFKRKHYLSRFHFYQEVLFDTNDLSAEGLILYKYYYKFYALGIA